MSEPAPKPHVSPSQLEMLSRCGEQYRRRYIEREIIPPGIAMLKGTGLHAGAAANMRQKIDTHVDLPAAEVADIAVAALESELSRSGCSFSEDEVSAGADKVLGQAKDATALLASAHVRLQAPEYQPLVVERRFRIVLPSSSHDIVGVVDMIPDTLRAVDFKTSRRRKSQADVNESVQLTTYAAAAVALTGQPAVGVRLDTLVHNSSGVSRQTLDADRGTDHYRSLAARASTAIAAVQSGVFVPASPGAWWCSQRWCGYWSSCPYVAGERLAKAPRDEGE